MGQLDRTMMVSFISTEVVPIWAVTSTGNWAEPYTGRLGLGLLDRTAWVLDRATGKVSMKVSMNWAEPCTAMAGMLAAVRTWRGGSFDHIWV